jgi:excisionase family DNA binding protein
MPVVMRLLVPLLAPQFNREQLDSLCAKGQLELSLAHPDRALQTLTCQTFNSECFARTPHTRSSSMDATHPNVSEQAPECRHESQPYTVTDSAQAPQIRQLPTLHSVSQVARYLGVGINTLYRLVRDRKIGSVRIGARVRFTDAFATIFGREYNMPEERRDRIGRFYLKKRGSAEYGIYARPTKADNLRAFRQVLTITRRRKTP